MHNSSSKKIYSDQGSLDHATWISTSWNPVQDRPRCAVISGYHLFFMGMCFYGCIDTLFQVANERWTSVRYCFSRLEMLKRLTRLTTQYLVWYRCFYPLSFLPRVQTPNNWDHTHILYPSNQLINQTNSFLVCKDGTRRLELFNLNLENNKQRHMKINPDS